MRLFALGVTVGLVMGLAAVASAAFVSTDVWGRMAPQSEFHLGYVAGIIDTVETLRSASFITREQTSTALDAIDHCGSNIQLGLLTARAESAVASGPAYPVAANIIISNLIKCQ